MADAAPPPPGCSELTDELERFKCDLRAGGLRESTIYNYLTGANLFVKWLAGEYQPGASLPERRPKRERAG